jgi:hypothetical protein
MSDVEHNMFRHARHKNIMNDVEHNMFRHIEQEQNEVCRAQYVWSYRTRTK